MELKSLKIARNCMWLVLSEQKKENALTVMVKEAKKDIEGCIKLLDERIEKLEKENAEIEGTGWTFPIMIDAEYSLEYLAKKKMTKKNDLFLFLKKQLEQIKEQIKSRSYNKEDLAEQVVLWDLYTEIFNKIFYRMK